MSDILDWLLDQMTEAINKKIDNSFSYEFYGSSEFSSTTQRSFLATTKRSKEMQINITIPDNDLDDLTIKDLIIADIHLSLICERLTNYDYDMKWLVEKREQVKDELMKRMKAQNRAKLQKLEAQRAALIPDSEKLRNIDEEILKLKNKMELKGL